MTEKFRLKEKLSGVFVPVITPFIDEEIEFQKLEENLKKLNKSHISGYFILGSNGENKSLSVEEKLKILEIFERNKNNKILIANIGCESTKETIFFSKEAAKRSVDFVSALTPSYFSKQINDDLLIYYYLEIAENINKPLLIYNAPGFAGNVKISPKAVRKLAVHPNIIGMKDSSPDGIISFINATQDVDDFCVLAGSISNFLTGLLFGASGGVISLANAFPEICFKLYNYYQKGDFQKAKELYFKLLKISNETSKYGVSGVKAMTTISGLYGGQPRKPLRELNESQTEEIRKILFLNDLI
jgi:4-hydroxy-2-oxoglutarate aldolase